MIYQVLSPVVMTVEADSFKEAVKNFVKLNHSLNINKIIIKDQNEHREAALEYFRQDGRNKVGINVYPASQSVIASLPAVSVSAPSLVIPAPVIPVANVSTNSGPLVGPGLDIGPTIGKVLSPVSPVISADVIVTSQNSNVAATKDSLLIGTDLISSPVAFSPVIVNI